MKKVLYGGAAAGLIALFALVAVPADAADVSCRVPFGFSVNGKTLPAGRYSVSTSQSILAIRGFDGGAFVQSNRLESGADAPARLVFHRYGDEYVLREVWLGRGMGRSLPETSGERALAKAARSGRTASLERVEIPLL